MDEIIEKGSNTMKRLAIIFVMALGVLSAANGSVNASVSHTGRFHSVNVTHPIHGRTSLPVHEGEVGVRHPESIAREGKTGRMVGCNLYQGCATEK